MVKLSQDYSPKHIAIIMDGNGRWAESRGLPRSDGHRAGVDAVKRTVLEVQKLGIKYLTLFGFSSENWKRPSLEIDDLMWLLRHFLKSETTRLLNSNVRIRVIGDRSNFSEDIVDLINKTEELTNTNDGLQLTAALSYGGRQEIVEAAKSMAIDIRGGELLLDDVDQKKFSNYLFTKDIPDPDLLIRTSGEQRISNFLLWQIAYTELVFCDVLWPDFSEQNLALAIKEFNSRERRFGEIAYKK
ncbi:MAG: Ditrans,polycis-undecaprenyl-diphosphate synthase ((2E,6E)-farnesyl-diphosphate specific) [Alphaproteobacteria bacterium MarineAlpha12_Bin1]|nr:MAG: Ditrans,polycis-undecaprenyl-diphosphate synthase ((2E,6E)-farnesyl-diphosphate specific) [Alphaproteobacteria bacterium MarineAlpha12_Bin1]